MQAKIACTYTLPTYLLLLRIVRNYLLMVGCFWVVFFCFFLGGVCLSRCWLGIALLHLLSKRFYLPALHAEYIILWYFILQGKIVQSPFNFFLSFRQRKHHLSWILTRSKRHWWKIHIIILVHSEVYFSLTILYHALYLIWSLWFSKNIIYMYGLILKFLFY